MDCFVGVRQSSVPNNEIIIVSPLGVRNSSVVMMNMNIFISKVNIWDTVLIISPIIQLGLHPETQLNVAIVVVVIVESMVAVFESTIIRLN